MSTALLLMVICCSASARAVLMSAATWLRVSPLGGLFSSLFFLIHYGGFCAVHGLFIMVLLVDPEADIFAGGNHWPFFLVFVELLIDVIRQVLAYAPPEWLWAFLALSVVLNLAPLTQHPTPVAMVKDLLE